MIMKVVNILPEYKENTIWIVMTVASEDLSDRERYFMII